jgi:hypothetical protein
MAAKKKVTVKVITDGIEVGGKWWHNGEEFTVTEKKAKELLKTGSVVKA